MVRRRLVAALCAALLVPVGHSSSMPVAMPGPRTVFITADVRIQLARDWDSVNPQQFERAYCLAVIRAAIPGDSAWVVVKATQAVPVSAGPEHVSFDCGMNPPLHIHTPTTCPKNDSTYVWHQCVLGGPGGKVPFESEPDRQQLWRTGAPFGVIQYGPGDFSVYFP